MASMSERDKPQLTEDEMNELVFADVNDPSAWGEPVVVGPSKGPRRMKLRHAKHMELASKFYVLSVLHRLGADATLMFSQSDNVDITVVLESGRALTVDVKTLTGPLEWQGACLSAPSGPFLTLLLFSGAGGAHTPPRRFLLALHPTPPF